MAKVTIQENKNKFTPVVVSITIENKTELNSIIEANRSIDQGNSIEDGEDSQTFYNIIEKIAKELEKI